MLRVGFIEDSEYLLKLVFNNNFSVLTIEIEPKLVYIFMLAFLFCFGSTGV
jgi:hypothetical protein